MVVGQSQTIASIVEWSTDGLNHNSPKPSSGSTPPIDFLQGGALSSISLPIERAPPIRNSLHIILCFIFVLSFVKSF